MEYEVENAVVEEETNVAVETEQPQEMTISARQWAEELVKVLATIDPVDQDVDFFTGWFANYWATVNDPMDSTIKYLQDLMAGQQAANNELLLRLTQARETIRQLDRAVMAYGQDEDKGYLRGYEDAHKLYGQEAS